MFQGAPATERRHKNWRTDRGTYRQTDVEEMTHAQTPHRKRNHTINKVMRSYKNTLLLCLCCDAEDINFFC